MQAAAISTRDPNQPRTLHAYGLGAADAARGEDSFVSRQSLEMPPGCRVSCRTSMDDLHEGGGVGADEGLTQWDAAQDGPPPPAPIASD